MSYTYEQIYIKVMELNRLCQQAQTHKYNGPLAKAILLIQDLLVNMPTVK